ncbi:YchJ family protein [Arcanobacterium haemolyticum]|nr:YchJ family protein [Arcanobacterium haemolyticum]
MKRAPGPVTICPCQSGRTYAECCRPFHLGEAEAPTAQALMRSRYSAFALGLTEYVARTWYPVYRPADLSDEGLSWRRLEILDARETGDHAFVEFRAHWRDGETRGVLHERSSFVREGGRWYYTLGVELD